MAFEEMVFGSFDSAERKAKLAYELYENGKVALALLKLEEAIEINPANSAWHFNRGLTLDSINRFSDAIDEYETALQSCPDDLEMLNSLAVDYTRTSQYDRAIEVFEYIQQLDPEFEPCYCNRIITYTETEQHELAEQMFYMGQQIDPDCALCFYNIGNNLFIRGQYKKAIYCWEKTAQLEPAHPQIHYRIAQAYWADDNSEDAHDHFLIELRNNPGDIDVIHDFGIFLLQSGQIEQAKKKFNRILELNPDFAPALFYLGEIAFNNADYEHAVKLYREALKLDNSLNGPCYRLAQYYLANQQLHKARAYLLSELELAPEDSNILISMASMFMSIDAQNHAAHCLIKAIDIDPSCADAYYYLGLLNASKGEFEEAAEFFAHALDIKPDHIWALKDSAIVCIALGRLDDAEQRLQRAKAVAGETLNLKPVSRKLLIAKMKRKILRWFSSFKP